MRFLIVAISIFSFLNSYASNFADSKPLTDAQAIELGMTPLDSVSSLVKKGRNKARNEYSLKIEHLDLAEIVVVVNKGERAHYNFYGQTVRVFQDGVLIHVFDVSTGTEREKVTTSGRRYVATTPTGIYRPKRAYLDYASKTFFGANMDYAVFFNGGIALHATDERSYKKLGSRASGGCIRLKREDARTINELIRSTGNGDGRWVDASVEGLDRKLYIDRIKLFDFNREFGYLLKNKKKLWTYKTAIVVVDR